MKNFILMLQFFTRLPININIQVKEEQFAKGVIFFPLVGLVIGLINAIVYFGCSIILSPLLSLVLVILLNVLLTGGLHLDGLADTCDGIFSARKKERMLEIMKDSRLGTNGAVAIFFDLALRISLLLSIPSNKIVITLIISNVISRSMIVLICYISSYARKEGGLGNLFIGKVSKSNLVAAFIIGISLSIILFNYRGIIAFLVAILFTIVFNKYISSILGGITGDILGAENELVEILVYITIVILGSRGLL